MLVEEKNSYWHGCYLRSIIAGHTEAFHVDRHALFTEFAEKVVEHLSVQLTLSLVVVAAQS
jgi:hypothetical protein